MTAKYTVCDNIAIITLDNPPVNGLGHATRCAIVDGLARAQQDTAIGAIVIMGAGSIFSGGADIREFNSPKALLAPSLHTVIAEVEGSAKPVIAAIHSTALGGGLELALGAHYRIAQRGAQVGLPEVKLGLLPGAGGTQRLPRAVGLETALNMIVSGTPVAVEQLAGTPLLEQVVEDKLYERAIAFAKEVAARGGPHPKVRDRKVKHENAAGFLEFSRNAIAAVSKHYPAPLKCVDAIEAACFKPFEAGMAIEYELFVNLLHTPESKAIRHAFFAERAAGKVADIPADTPLRDIRKIAVIGAGTMGGGISMNFLNAGLPVVLLESKQEALDRGLAMIHKNYDSSVKKGKLKPEQMAARLALLSTTLSYEQLADADLVIEAVFEDIGVKQSVFRQLDEVLKPGAILASNTSTLDLNRIAAFTSRPQDVVGLHFFSPANVMPLLEVVRGEKTAKDVLATVLKLAKLIRKKVVVAGVCDGFIGNRMIEQYSRQALFLLDEGALPQQIDRAIEKFGFAMGPFRMSDLAGNDIGWAVRKRRALEAPEVTYSKNADLLCEQGRFGQKTGAGWYDYKPGNHTPYPSQLVDDLVIAHSNTLGLTRRKISDQEIVERLVFSLVNEGANILTDGIAARASDIDLAYLTGYGFPVWRGGPMFYADTVGLPNVLRSMRRYAQGYQGSAWKPAPLLIELAEAGRGFND